MSTDSTALATVTPISAPAPLPDTIIDALVQGDLAQLKPADRAKYYKALCERIGIDPAFQPFSYLVLNGKLTLYANKSCAEQLRKNHDVSVKITARQTINDVYAVTATATLPSGRVDESLGAVNIGALKGDNLANALMKAETKSKRRVTLSICGLGMLDETEVETCRNARRVSFEEAAQDVVPLGLTADVKPPTAPEVKAAYAALREKMPGLPEDVKTWATVWLQGRTPTKGDLANIMAKINTMLTEVDAKATPTDTPPTPAAPTATEEQHAQEAEYRPDPALTPPPHCNDKITASTRGKLMQSVAKLGWTEKKDRLGYAEQNGLPVTSYNELCEHQAKWLADRAWADVLATMPCAKCGKDVAHGESHTPKCPENIDA